MKVAIIIGHNEIAQGAEALPPIEQSEYRYYEGVANEMSMQAPPWMDLRIFRRVKTRGYSREIDAVYRLVDEFDADISLELHFNSANPSASGSEVFTSGSSRSMKLATAVQKQQLAALGLPSRGVKMLRKKDRGGRSLWSGRAPAVLIEPFFGSNAEDCEAAHAIGKEGMASMLLAGIADYRENS